jgi:hypothetical protein
MTVNDGDVDDTIFGIYNGSTGRSYIVAESIAINATNVAYSGFCSAYSPLGTGTAPNTILSDSITVTSASGAGTGFAVFFASGSTGMAEVR